MLKKSLRYLVPYTITSYISGKLTFTLIIASSLLVSLMLILAFKSIQIVAAKIIFLFYHFFCYMSMKSHVLMSSSTVHWI